MADRKKGMEIGMAEYANIIVDIYQGKLDKTFQYRVPERLKSTIAVGMLVAVPFGSRKMQGYVIELTDVCEYEEDKIKEILSIVKGGVLIESQMIALAGWMRENYGGTMNHALKTVLPVKEKKKAKEQKTIRLALHPVEAKNGKGKTSCGIVRTAGVRVGDGNAADVCFRVRDSCDGGSRYCKSGE